MSSSLETANLANRLHRLGEIAKVFVGLPTKPMDAEQTVEAGVSVLTVRCLDALGVVPAEIIRLDVSAELRLKYAVRQGDVLLPARSTVLKVGVVPPELDGAVINATLIAIRCLPAIEPELLAEFFNHPRGQAAVQAVSQSGTLQLNITVKALESLEIPVPPVEQQRRMVELIRAAREACQSAIGAAQTRVALARQIAVAGMYENTESFQPRLNDSQEGGDIHE